MSSQIISQVPSFMRDRTRRLGDMSYTLEGQNLDLESLVYFLEPNGEIRADKTEKLFPFDLIKYVVTPGVVFEFDSFSKSENLINLESMVVHPNTVGFQNVKQLLKEQSSRYFDYSPNDPTRAVDENSTLIKSNSFKLFFVPQRVFRRKNIREEGETDIFYNVGRTSFSEVTNQRRELIEQMIYKAFQDMDYDYKSKIQAIFDAKKQKRFSFCDPTVTEEQELWLEASSDFQKTSNIYAKVRDHIKNLIKINNVPFLWEMMYFRELLAKTNFDELRGFNNLEFFDLDQDMITSIPIIKEKDVETISVGETTIKVPTVGAYNIKNNKIDIAPDGLNFFFSACKGNPSSFGKEERIPKLLIPYSQI